MTRRKPPGLSQEQWVERLIREAQERGEFDNLPGAGKPIEGLDRPHDELWWVKRLLEREKLSLTPETLALRKELEAALARVAEQTSEDAVRRIVAGINERIRDVNARAVSGPPSDIAPLDADAVVRKWRASSP